jgi:hypothetical protein
MRKSLIVLAKSAYQVTRPVAGVSARAASFMRRWIWHDKRHQQPAPSVQRELAKYKPQRSVKAWRAEPRPIPDAPVPEHRKRMQAWTGNRELAEELAMDPSNRRKLLHRTLHPRDVLVALHQVPQKATAGHSWNEYVVRGPAWEGRVKRAKRGLVRKSLLALLKSVRMPSWAAEAKPMRTRDYNRFAGRAKTRLFDKMPGRFRREQLSNAVQDWVSTDKPRQHFADFPDEAAAAHYGGGLRQRIEVRVAWQECGSGCLGRPLLWTRRITLALGRVLDIGHGRLWVRL